MEVWVKFQQADFESQVIQTIVAAGMCKLHIRKTCYITGAVIICSIINESLYLIFKKNYLSAFLYHKCIFVDRKLER